MHTILTIDGMFFGYVFTDYNELFICYPNMCLISEQKLRPVRTG